MWKEASDSNAGDSTKYGAPDVKKISQMFSAQDISDTVSIHANVIWTFKNSALRIRNPADTFSYTIVPSEISAARNATLPLLTGNDQFTFDSHATTIISKTVNLTNNTVTDTSAAAGDLARYNGTKFVKFPVRETFIIRFGDNNTVPSVANGQYEWQMPYNWQWTDVYATVSTVASTGTTTIQIQQNALDVLSTAITIDATEKSSRTAAVPAVIADNTLDVDGIITFDIDVVGSGTKGLVLYMIGYQR